MERSIIHLNVADFAAAVERNSDPSLKGYPVIIAPTGKARAIVYDMSEEAFRDGVRKGMPLGKAARISRHAKVLAPRFHTYERAMQDLIRKALVYSPLIESGTADGHLFIDATGTSRLFGPAVDVAWRLNKEMKRSLSLDPVWSVAPNKLVAKVATRLVKPVGEYIVGSGEEEAFLAPLPLDLIPGLLETEVIRLSEFNLHQVAQVRSLGLEQLEIAFPERATTIFQTLCGIDNEAVARAGHDHLVLTADHEFDEDTNTLAELKRGLYAAVVQICRHLRAGRVNAGSLALTLLYSDGVQQTSLFKINPPTANDLQMFPQCLGFLDKVWTRRIRIRHLRLACKKTTSPQVQMELFDVCRKSRRQGQLIRSMDQIRSRFGPGAVTTGLAVA